MASSRTLRTLSALLSMYRVDTVQKAFARLAPPALAVVLFAAIFPNEFAQHWGKVASALIAWLLVAPFVYFWTYHTLPKEQKPAVGWSPFYNSEFYRQYQAEQVVVRQRAARVSAKIAELVAAMMKLDITTPEGQDRLRQLSQQKSEAEQELAALPKPAALGFRSF